MIKRYYYLLKYLFFYVILKGEIEISPLEGCTNKSDQLWMKMTNARNNFHCRCGGIPTAKSQERFYNFECH